jgi:hypothetical protein
MWFVSSVGDKATLRGIIVTFFFASYAEVVVIVGAIVQKGWAFGVVASVALGRHECSMVVSDGFT